MVLGFFFNEHFYFIYFLLPTAGPKLMALKSTPDLRSKVLSLSNGTTQVSPKISIFGGKKD